MNTLTKKEIEQIKNLREAKELLKAAIKKLGKYDAVLCAELIHAPHAINEVVKLIRTTRLYK